MQGFVSQQSAGVLRSLRPALKRRLPLILLVAGLGVIAGVWLLRGYLLSLKVVGYPGVVFLSFLGSLTAFLSLPGLISVCGLSLMLTPLVIGLLAGLGETLGEAASYAVGYGGSPVVERRRFYLKLKQWMERRGALFIFVVSAIPNPIFDIVALAAGGVHYPFRRFVAVVLMGKTIKGVMVAYTCFYGVTMLPWVG